MDTINIASFQEDLARHLDKVNNDHIPLLITREDGKPAIVMSLEDYNAFEATAYLLASPRNASRVNESIAELESGAGVVHELIEE